MPQRVEQRKLAVIVAAIVLCLAGAAVFYFFTVYRAGSSAADSGTLKLGTGASAATFELDVAADQQSQSRGLSGRDGLAANEGLRFSYGSMGQRCIWMKDMKFNIDVLWLDASGRVISMVQDISPGTYPQTYCADAQDVVELPAGTLKKHGVRPGQVVQL